MNRLSLIEIETLAHRALEKAGATPQAAASLARALAEAEREGLSSHGLAYLGLYCDHLQCGKVIGSAVPQLERPAPGLVTVDAGAGFAHPAIDLGFEALVPLARSQGIAALSVYNSYNCGVLGYHTRRLAIQGLVGLGFTNAPASIAPSGGRKPVFGTNPWSVAAPGADRAAPIVVDQSASVVAKSEVMKKARLNEAMPLGWALTPDGEPTTDPHLGLKGTMVPAGGYKGVGSALLVELMAACLTGASLGVEASPFGNNLGGPPRTGQFFIAIAPAATSHGAFTAKLAALNTALAADPAVHVPGAGRQRASARSDEEGIAVDPVILERARALAG